MHIFFVLCFMNLLELEDLNTAHAEHFLIFFHLASKFSTIDMREINIFMFRSLKEERLNEETYIYI